MQNDADGHDTEARIVLLAASDGVPHVPLEAISALPLPSTATQNGAGTVALGTHDTASKAAISGDVTVSISVGVLHVPPS